ncbi:YchJ family protein [Sphingobacterium faecale]|uniref:Zinc chelation protein SecC n=1 Tax=Sphingobacterium faecale TaxID=2803775 RepID=A0ABS1R3R4_9SPHI|nr:YchJ family metal-binding protein [Sphingobacterium faecale]MBL1409351.1 zinc chelation protein SecC [Sphingobacterium faecale]
MTVCYCGSAKDFENCCSLIHSASLSASSAEILMRARYSAFVVGDVSFLYNTFHPSTRRYQSKQDIKNWSTQNKWLKLEIINSTQNTVEFRASYKDQANVQHVHHEKSNFKELQGQWYYIDGRLIQ